MGSETWACISVFNEVKTLETTIRSVVPFVDHLLVVDGAYAYFPYLGANGRSDDGTNELVRELMKEIPKLELIGCMMPWESEMQKRTVYCGLVPDGDWIFIIDADEKLVFGGEWLKLLESVNEARKFNAGICLMYFKEGDHYGTMARIYRKLPTMHYDQGHAHVIRDGPDGHRWSELWLPIVIEEDHAARSPEREKLRQEFYASNKMK
jgi:hypothetical protein